MDSIINWLLENDNPAVQYRTKTEILCEQADKQKVIDWVNKLLPTDWQNTKGLWYTYYLTSIAECGLTYNDILIEKDRALNHYSESSFDFGCGDFMFLRTLVMLGLSDEEPLNSIISNLKHRQLPDGGFLCLHRLNKLKYISKSCVKSTNLSLLFCAECKKRGIELEITDDLIAYFWEHNLFYKTSNLSALILNTREGWRTVDTFYPFEVMRVGLQNIVEAFCAMGYGNDDRLKDAWELLNGKRNKDGQIMLNGTLTKSYLPKERVNKPSKWATFYTLLAEKEMSNV